MLVGSRLGTSNTKMSRTGWLSGASNGIRRLRRAEETDGAVKPTNAAMRNGDARAEPGRTSPLTRQRTVSSHGGGQVVAQLQFERDDLEQPAFVGDIRSSNTFSGVRRSAGGSQVAISGKPIPPQVAG